MQTNDILERSHRTPIIVFDGVCVMCNSWVKFLLRFNRAQAFLFCTAQSETGIALLKHFNQNTEELDSVLLVWQAKVYTHSNAVLRIFSQLPIPWRWLAGARYLPSTIRDRAYTFVARRRYRWFGRFATCPVPSSALKARILD